MPDFLADLLDLHLAWRRVRHDNVTDHVFIHHPYEISLIEHNLESWLASIEEDLREKRYSPGSMVICEAPKPSFSVRPGSQLSLRDQVVYTACVGAFSDRIRNATDAREPRIDFSYQISPNPSDPTWLLPYFKAWRGFDRSSLRQIDAGIPYVIHADLAGYYENVDIDLLISDLAQLDVPEVLTSFLKTCLYRWSQTLVPGRGLPQGFSASDVLAKLYLSTVDQSLRERGYSHFRYVDDYRVFCQSLPEAKKAFADLSHLMRRKGLVFQSAKSKIYRADESRTMIEGIQPILQGILGQFVSTIGDLFGMESPYFTLWDAERMLAESVDDTPIEIIRRAYQTYFIESDPSKFDKTLFRFLLRRLGHHGDDFALDHSLALLARHPEETRDILRYVAQVQAVESSEEDISGFLFSDENVYWYQSYQIISWRTQLPFAPQENLLTYVRWLAFQSAAPAYVISVCRDFLGIFGTSTDLDRIEDAYAGSRDDLEKVEIICSLRRMERGRRNSFLARVQSDGEIVKWAVNIVRRENAKPTLKLLK